jgi:Tfp pilus assembly protein PilV
MRMTGRKAVRVRRGLTLVEALATVLVLAIVFPSLMQATTLCVRASGVARHRAEATALADSKLSEVIATGAWQNSEGNFEDEAPEYFWSVDVTDWEEAGMEEVHVAVTWFDGGDVREVAASTLVYSGATTSTTQAASAGGVR